MKILRSVAIVTLYTNSNAAEHSLRRRLTLEQSDVGGTSQKILRSNIGVKESKLDCILQQVMMQYSNAKEDEFWECVDEETDKIYDLNYRVDSDFKDPVAGRIVSGVTALHSNSIVMVSREKVAIRDKPWFEQKATPYYHRRNLNTNGSLRSVLVVRVDARDTATALSEENLAQEIFGNKDSNGNNANWNLKSAFNQCSYGKLQIIPATHDRANSGVYSVSINENMKGLLNTYVRSKVLDKVSTDLNVPHLNHAFDHVILCLPPGLRSKSGKWSFIVNFKFVHLEMNHTAQKGPYLFPASQLIGNYNWTAFGVVNGFVTVFNNDWCKSTSAVMHEIGHNLGLYHSNENGEEYEDTSGMMGHSFHTDDKPVMCFNTVKHWSLGWFEDRQVVVKPLQQGSWEGSLIGYADYLNSAAPPSSVIAVKIEGDNKSFFVGFNHVAGINRENQELDSFNKVTIHSAGGIQIEESNLEAKLNVGDSFEIPKFGGLENTLRIYVEYITMTINPPVAKINIQLLRCTSDADCDDNSSCTTDTCNVSTGKCAHKTNDFCGDIIKVVLLTDRYPAETSWKVTDDCNNDAVVMEGDGYRKAFEKFEVQETHTKSRYTFKIKDEYGDGICCDVGEGSYHVYVNNDLIADGGEYLKTEYKSWGTCEDVVPTISPTPCKVPYELKFQAGQSWSTNWNFSHGLDDSKIVAISSGVYRPRTTHTEVGCLQNDCFRFRIRNAYSYALTIDGYEVAREDALKYEEEITLFGTCARSQNS